MCNKVDLSYTNLSAVKSLRFKEGAEAYLRECTNLPTDLDVSMCSKVNFTNTDLSPVQSLKFKEGAKAILDNTNLPETLDISMCSIVYLSNVGISAVKSLKAKNRQQLDAKELIIPDNWQGKIIYTDDIQSAKTFAYATQNTGR